MAKKHTSSKLKAVKKEFFQLHLILEDTSPEVWRRIIVPGGFTLQALHSVIQMSMGWQMSHLYDFNIGEKRYSEPDENGDLQALSVQSSLSVAFENYEEFDYHYDFGDGWTHKVKIEKKFERCNMRAPVCVDGGNACPPEDCGGTSGFENLKNVISNPENEEYEDLMNWLGGIYLPNTFDLNRINRDLLWMTNWDFGPNDQGLYHPFKE